MSKLTYLRMAGYVFALTMNGVNCAVMINSLFPPKIEALNFVITVKWTWFTIWNVCFQMLYAILGLMCDGLTLIRGKRQMARLIALREQIFSVVVWTAGCIVATVFWPLFLYDRSLIYPAFIDEGIPPGSNYIMHGGILVVLLWELLCLPRQKISHKTSLKIMAMILTVYVAWVQYSYMVTGLWPYPVIKLIYGTVYLPIALLGGIVLTLFYYFIQWPIVHYIWGKPCQKVE